VDLPPEAKALLALPPSRFTAERNALASALAARRDPAAAQIRKLARPIGLAWVLNRLARERPREVGALLAAGEGVRAGQHRAVSGAGAGALREAEDALRDRARALRLDGERILAAEGRRGAPAPLARLELLLRLAATGTDREAFREGTLVREPAPWGGELSGFALVAGGKDAATARARAAGRVEAARETRRRDGRAEKARERERARAIAKARTATARAKRRAEREERAAAEAERRVKEARERAAAAREEADRAAAKVIEMERRS
jgi:hypothetical protein